MKDENNLDEKKLRDFDAGGLSLWKMNFGLWLVENRPKIGKFVVIFLVFLSAFFFIFSAYQYIRYYLAGDPNEGLSAENLVQSPRQVTEELRIEPLQVFSSAQKTDLAVAITNPNAKFLATFRYCFRQVESEIACGSDFILPGGKKHVLALGLPLRDVANLTFALEEVSWRRISARQIADWEGYASERLRFSVSDLQFVPAHRSELSGKVELNSLALKVANNSPYGYYQVPVNLLFYSQSRLLGVNRYVLNNFLSGQQRSVNLSWSAPLSAVDRIETEFSVNVMDEAVYLPYRGN